MLDAPVVEATPSGAALTSLGEALVAAYRALEADTEAALERRFAALRGRMRQRPADRG
jgi:molybdenum-dependent DNA-binding transcriptional regulator ModE